MTPIRLGPGPEFDRITRAVERLGPVAAGVGDDCAIVPTGEGTLVASSDLSVEGVHFQREWLRWEEVGWRATAAALSDLAACGASAVGILVSIGISPSHGDACEDILAGAGAAAAAVGAAILGGDLSRADQTVVDVSVIGRALRPVPRTGATPGDSLWLTGMVGGARAALEAWLGGSTPDDGAREAFAHPHPRIGAGQWLATHGAVAMIDVSDGIASDTRHLAAASGVALEVHLDRIPLGPGVEAIAPSLGESPQAFAAVGGEDYELLAVLPPSFRERDAVEFRGTVGLPLSRVGEVRSGAGVTFLAGDRVVELIGFDHFR